MDWLKTSGGWIVAGIVTVLAAVAAFWYERILRDRAAAANARADGAQKVYGPRIKAKQQRLIQLTEQAGADTKALEDARAELEVAKAALASKFRSAGLTVDEVVARFAGLDLGPDGGIDTEPG